MTATSIRTTPETGGAHLASRPRLLPGLTVAAVGAVAAVVGATVLPNVAAGTPMPNMTHYMGLLAANQPWNLLLFMAVPVVLAETVAVTELALLFSRSSLPRPWRLLNRYAGMVLGVYFVVVFGYLLANAAIPLTTSGGWRGPADVIAVGAYLAGVVPLAGIAALEIGLLAQARRPHPPEGARHLRRGVPDRRPRRHDRRDARPGGARLGRDGRHGALIPSSPAAARGQACRRRHMRAALPPAW